MGKIVQIDINKVNSELRTKSPRDIVKWAISIANSPLGAYAADGNIVMLAGQGKGGRNPIIIDQHF